MTSFMPKAISLHFHIIPEKPGYVINVETKKEYSLYDILTKILVYEDRVIYWFFNYGNELKKFQDAAFVVLQIAVSQIEGMEQYRKGQSSKKQSPQFFLSGMSRIFSLTTSETQQLTNADFYGQVRCGLFHDGMTRDKVIIEPDYNLPIEFKTDTIFIGPKKFFDAVYQDFINYIAELKNPANAQLRNDFEQFWDNR